MRLRWSILVVVVVSLGLAMPRGGLAQRPIAHTTYYHDPWDDDDDDLETLAIAGVVAGVACAAPVWVPYTLLDRREEGVDSFSEYPYENGYQGFMTDGIGQQSSALPFSLRGGAEYGLNFDHVHTVGGKLAIDFPSYRLTFDSGWTSYFERDSQGGGTDDFTVGDVNLVVRFVESPRSVWRTGLGVNWLADSGGEAGFNFTYGVDYFPVRPVVWSSELDWGTLAGDTLLRLRSTLGLQVRNCELYAGVEYLDLREEHFTTMLFGLRYWW